MTSKGSIMCRETLACSGLGRGGGEGLTFTALKGTEEPEKMDGTNTVNGPDVVRISWQPCSVRGRKVMSERKQGASEGWVWMSSVGRDTSAGTSFPALSWPHPVLGQRNKSLCRG